MEHIIKRDKVIKALKDAGLYNIFVTVEEPDFTLFQTTQYIQNTGRCLITVTVDNRVFNSIHFYLGQLENPGKKQKMLDLMNELNRDDLLIRYYLDGNDAIMARITYTVPNEKFDSNFFVNLITIGYNILANNHYSQIMRLIWS